MGVQMTLDLFWPHPTVGAASEWGSQGSALLPSPGPPVTCDTERAGTVVSCLPERLALRVGVLAFVPGWGLGVGAWAYQAHPVPSLSSEGQATGRSLSGNRESATLYFPPNKCFSCEQALQRSHHRHLH